MQLLNFIVGVEGTYNMETYVHCSKRRARHICKYLLNVCAECDKCSLPRS